MDILTYDELYKLTSEYIHKEEDQALMKKAYDYAYLNHKGQFRKSGEPYIIHPLNVAYILAELHTGPATICAGLLHDVVEDTTATCKDIENLFSKDIAELVDGVTKVGKLQFASLEDKQAENHQHLLLAMSHDIRVIVVKLADRLHNMRTLGSLNSEKQARISKETLEIYAPLAHKLGMFKIKAELEDAALKYSEPLAYNKITSLIKDDKSKRANNIDKAINEIKEMLSPYHFDKIEIKGRVKNVYSIYKKMKSQKKEFEDIYDVLAIRIIVNTIGECYQVLGLIHAKYAPVPMRFKDYIAVPKANMYQSLHTTVMSSDLFTFEVQIRTFEMDEVAEKGIAAHWAYKEGVKYDKAKEQFEIASKLKWYGELMQFSEEDRPDNAREYVDTVKEEILLASVYVYTPNGKVIDLPKGSTPIDFAYKIHTNIGNKMSGAIVNKHIVPLDYELKSMDIVSIMTNNNSFGPSENWLKIAKTAHAKHKIKAFLNKQNKEVLLTNGKFAIEEEFRIQKVLTYTLDDKFAQHSFSKNNVNSLDELYLEVGKGNISSKTVVAKYVGDISKDLTEEAINRQIERNQKILTTNSDTGVVVEGLSNPQLKLGSCCCPIPGDKIVGFVTKGNGIVVHHLGCKNLSSFQNERLIQLEWATNPGRKYPVSIKIFARNTPNLLIEIMNIVSANNMSILAIQAKNTQDLETIVKLKVMTNNLSELETMIVNMKKIKNVYSIERDCQ